jgi:WD40 repeat protein
MRAASLTSALVACAISATAFAGQPSPLKVVWSRPAGAEAVAFSPDGRFVASGGLQGRDPRARGRVDVWSAADGTHLGHAETHGESGVIGYTEDLAFSPDGLTLATANGSTWCGATGGCVPDRPGLFTWSVPMLKPTGGRVDLTPASAVEYSPDGTMIAAAYYDDREGAGRTHGAGDLATLQETAGHLERANDITWSPDGMLVASVGDDGDLRVWVAETGTLVLTLAHGEDGQGGEPVSVAFSPDGSLVATTGEGSGIRTRVWRVSDGKRVHDLESQITPTSYGRNVVAFTPNGRYVVGGFQQFVAGQGWRGRIRFWNVTTGEVAAEYTESGSASRPAGVTSLAFSGAEPHRFACTVGGTVKLAEAPLALSGAPVADARPSPPVPRPTPVTPEPAGSAPVAIVPLPAAPVAIALLPTAPAASRTHGPAAPSSADIRIGEARPDPARTNVVLTIEVTDVQDVRAALFDALGRRVAKPFAGRLHPGAPEELSFDARALAGGRYEIRIETESGTVTRPVSLTR